VVIDERTTSEGIAAGNRWLAERYPGHEKVGQALSFLSDRISRKPSRWYDEVEFVTPSGEHPSVCFDMTSFYGKR
jgi:hypothetical protein